MTEADNGKLNLEPEIMSPLILAYVGDAVFELYVRQSFASEIHNLHKLHENVIKWVNAGSQGKLLQRIEPFLDAKELRIVKRGRNAKSNVPRNVDMAEYRRSTGFEALIGYLYLAGQRQRLDELLALAGLRV